jgi:hypothetical protein
VQPSIGHKRPWSRWEKWRKDSELQGVDATVDIVTNMKYKNVSTYVKQHEPLAMSAERTRFRCAPLIMTALRHELHHLMRQAGSRSRSAQCGLPRRSPPHTLPAPPECQIPADCQCNVHCDLSAISDTPHGSCARPVPPALSEWAQ